MGQLYCFSCGKALSDNEQERAGGGPVPICDNCREVGPQVDPGDVRWMVRRSDGPMQGPLSREGVHDRLARELLGPYDQVCRVNAEWQRLVEHPDFRGCFIPGTPEFGEIEKLKGKIGAEKAAENARQRNRILRASALLVVGIVLPIITTTQGLGVLPESWVSSARGVFGGVVGEAKGVIAKSSGQKAPASAEKPTKMPAQNAINRLKDAYPKVEEPLELLLVRGQRELWEGTAKSLSAARDDLEKAVASAPEDPEAVAGLAIAYAALLRAERGEVITVVELAQRAEVLAPGTVSALRARGVAALVSGDRAKAAEHATACLAVKPAAEPGKPPPAPREDPGCAALLAVANGDESALGALHERFPDAAPIGLGLLWVASEKGDHPTVLKVGRALARRHPDDAAAYAFLSRSAAATARWKEAREAAGAAGKAAPWMLDQRALHAELLLKTEGRAADAVEVYDALFADPLWKEKGEKAPVLTGAAIAAMEAGKLDKALAWSEAALAEDKTSLGAVLTRARAMLASGKTDQVEPVLSTIDNSRLQGREGARYLVGVARIYLAMDQNKPASTALDAALELDPGWIPAHLERTRAWLLGGNPSAAMKQMLALPLLDVSEDGARSPLVATWYSEPAWDDLRRSLEASASTDVRLAADAPAALGVLAWATGAGDARAALKRAVDQKPDAFSAHAALGWLLLERGEAGAALSHIESVLADQPQAGLIHALRARALTQLGRTGDAEKAFGQAMINASKVSTVYRWRAELRAKTGDAAGERADLEKALELAPGDLIAAVRLAELDGA